MSIATAALTESRRRDSASRRQRVVSALERLAAAGDDLSVSSVARAARVHRSFIYRHADLHAAVLTRATQDIIPPDGSRAGRQALQAELANALHRSSRQTHRINQLEVKLSQILGESAWRESGLGAPKDADQLQQRVTTLEQQLAGTAAELAARDEDLTAARNANRELMAQLNHGNPAPKLRDHTGSREPGNGTMVRGVTGAPDR